MFASNTKYNENYVFAIYCSFVVSVVLMKEREREREPQARLSVPVVACLKC